MLFALNELPIVAPSVVNPVPDVCFTETSWPDGTPHYTLVISGNAIMSFALSRCNIDTLRALSAVAEQAAFDMALTLDVSIPGTWVEWVVQTA